MTEGNLIKIDGDILYASEIVEMSKSLKSYTEANNFQLIQNGALNYNEIDNTYLEVFSGDTAQSKTNLIHRTDTKEYYTITPGAYELITDIYETEDNCNKCYCFIDYAIYKNITETPIKSSIHSSGSTDTNNSSNIINEKTLLLKFNLSGRANNADFTNKINITDGSSTSTLVTNGGVSIMGANSKTGFIKIYNDTTNKKLKYFVFCESKFSDDEVYYKDDVTYGEVDYSGWGSELYLQTYAYDDTAVSSTATIYYIRSYKQNPTTDATIEISSDNGSNYKEITNGTYAILTSGNQFKAKISGTLASGEGITIKKVILKPE